MNIIVTALFTLTLASWASASARSVTPRAECKFDKGMCGWRSDPTNPWLITTLNKSTPQFLLPNSSWPILCLFKEVPQEANSGESWFADDVNPSAFKTLQYLIQTRLRSPSVPASLGLRCLTFSFFYLGRRVGAARGHLGLALLLQKPGSCSEFVNPTTGKRIQHCEPETLWSANSTSVFSTWSKAVVSLDSGESVAKSDFQIILEGVIPAGYPDARICVDNITSYTVPCSELEPKPLKPSTAKYTWAQYFGITFIVALAFGLLIPVLFLVGIIVVCRRRHAYRHHHCMTNGSGGGMSVSGAGSGSYGNSKLFSANLWHYIGGKEVDDDPFAEHTASIHRPPFSAHKFSDGTLGMRGDGTLDLPDVVIPSGRVVGGTLIRQTSQPAYNGAPYGYQTMVTTGKAMRYNGVPMGPPSNMLASQPNFTMDFNSQSAMPNMVQQGSQQMMIPIAGAPAPSQVMVQTDAAQQMMVQPANYFQSLAQPATPLSGSGAQPVMIAPAPAATGAITMTTSAVPVAAPAGANVAMDDNGPFVLPDPPSDHQQERDQVAAALDALNAATEPPQPHQTTSAAAVASGEHPPPGYDEAVGMAITRPAGGADAAAAPVLPPRRTAPANNAAVAAESLSLAQRYGLPVAEI